MIGELVYAYCKEDLSLIENYDKAINDKTQIWDCHHRLEIELNLSARELQRKHMYFDRPASELIFLTHSEHTILHQTNRKRTQTEKRKISKTLIQTYKENPELIENMSKLRKGRKVWSIDAKFSEEHRKHISESKINYYKDPENRRKQSERAKGRRAWNKGMTKEEMKNYKKK